METNSVIGRAHDSNTEGWEIRVLSSAEPADQLELSRLRERVPHHLRHDRIQEQLTELCEVRNPRMPASDIPGALARHLDGRRLGDYGNWIYYPWSTRLVHVLPEGEFAEVRLSRNRNKISATEQVRLRELTIGIVGLSVGQMTAAALATEGVGGTFILADFDTIGLSNLNRLRASIHDIGVNKAVATARQLYEIDPYLRIRIFTEGLRESSLEPFLSGPPAVDLLVEECDDMFIKWRIREAARERGIPVVMETSDRGMLDVERYDLDRRRALFHGLAGHLSSADIAGMSADAKLAIGLEIVGTDTISPRLAASAVEIGTTLKSWPQLASAVLLGAAVNTDTIRRIALGELTHSGRFWVDLEQIVRDPAQASPKNDPPPAPPVAVRNENDTSIDFPAWLRAVVGHATAAPSGGNQQPWRFFWNGRRLRCVRDPARSGSLLDFELRATWLALGAAAENAALAAASEGRHAELHAFPSGLDADTAWDMQFAGGPIARDPLAEAITARCTNRRLGRRTPLPPDTVDRLRHEARSRGAVLQVIDAPDAMARLGDVLGRGDRIRFLSRAMHDELMQELRWTPKEAEASADGIDVRTLELGFTDLAALRLLRSWPAMDLLARSGGGGNLEKFAHRTAAASSAFGLLTIEGSSRLAILEGGRALQRVWLAATLLGCAFQPVTALPYLFMRAEAGGDRLDSRETAALLQLHGEYRALVNVPRGHSELMLFRLGVADAPTERSLRRTVDDVLSAG